MYPGKTVSMAIEIRYSASTFGIMDFCELHYAQITVLQWCYSSCLHMYFTVDARSVAVAAVWLRCSGLHQPFKCFIESLACRTWVCRLTSSKAFSSHFTFCFGHRIWCLIRNASNFWRILFRPNSPGPLFNLLHCLNFWQALIPEGFNCFSSWET